MINVEMTKSSGVTLATENTICNENVKVTIANGENLIAENIKKDVQIADVVGTFEGGGGDDTVLKGLIQRDITEIVIPDSVTSIGSYAFYGFNSLNKISLPNSLITIGACAFMGCSSLRSLKTPLNVEILPKQMCGNCTSLSSVTFLGDIKQIGVEAFLQCYDLKELILPNSLIMIDNDAFTRSGLVNVNLPTSLTSVSTNAFRSCTKLEFVTLEQGFNANNLNLSASNLYTAETIVSWIEALADRTGQSTYILTIGSTNIAKLTEEQIAIATNKNWTLA